MKAIRIIAAILAVGAAASHCRAESASDGRIAALIELLASPNEAPPKGRSGSYDLSQPPESYKKQGQVVVFLAAQQLLSEGDVAFDLLIKHFDDKRYSYTYDTPEGLADLTVGVVCEKIMRRNIFCYEDLGILRQFTNNGNHFHDKLQTDLRQWWSNNRDKPLWQSQIEMIDRQIAHFNQLDLENLPPIVSVAKKMSLAQRTDLRMSDVTRLKDMKAGIAAAKEPYRSRTIDNIHARFTWLPWTTETFNQ